jgi:hypothetical protein
MTISSPDVNEEKFQILCQELNQIVPIKWQANGSIRRAYIETLAPPITLGGDRAKIFYGLIKKYKLHRIESIPSGFGTAYTLFRHESPEFFE